ncbi:MAG TPA: hypothetical protein EYP04_04100 [Anaerolineae bacterium]|nr:hypothetical protein [Anaerolineae bacterium]
MKTNWVCVLVLCLMLAIAAPAAPISAEGGPGVAMRLERPKPGGDVVNLMQPIQDLISGPGWLMAQGLDPRPWLDRPGWDPLKRLKWEQAGPPLSGDQSPAQQGIGPGPLVPYRSPAPAFSRDLLVTRDYSKQPLQTEPHLAVNPQDPDHILIGAIDYNFPNVSTYVSIDGGAMWDGPHQLPYLRGDRVSGGDPVVGFDRAGNAYISFISIGVEEFSIGPFVGFALVSSVAVARSEDGGFTWKESISAARSLVSTKDTHLDEQEKIRGEVSLSFLDKPWMAVGPHPDDPDRDVIYVTYTDFVLKYQILYIGELPVLSLPKLETTIRMVRSEDGGVSWSTPIAVSPTVRRVYGEVPEPIAAGPAVGTKRIVQGSQIAVGPEGNVYVAWLDSTDDDSMEGLAELYMARSEDGGKTFSEPVRLVSFLEPGFRPRTAFFRYWSTAFPQVGIGSKGEVYVVYTALPPDKPGDDGDIYFLRSLDGGKTWGQSRRLNQDNTDRVQFFPGVAVSPDGVIHVTWGDMRDDPAETRYHIYYTRSEDQGETWGFELPELGIRSPDTRVTDFPSNPNKGFPYGLFIGDYFAIAATEKDVYIAWADTRLGEFGSINQKIGFTRQRPLPSPELFISPAEGPGGQSVTIRGHHFQPDMNVFVQVGGVTVATGRTDSEGRITTELFVPISGEGAHQVQLFDESGNFATASFYMEFGFDNVQDVQQELTRRLRSVDERLQSVNLQAVQSLGERLQGLDPQTVKVLGQEMHSLRQILEQRLQVVPDVKQQKSVPLPGWPWSLSGPVGLLLGAVVTYMWIAYRRRKP